jgi:hypothetical protein
MDALVETQEELANIAKERDWQEDSSLRKGTRELPKNMNG